MKMLRNKFFTFVTLDYFDLTYVTCVLRKVLILYVRPAVRWKDYSIHTQTSIGQICILKFKTHENCD